MTMPMIEKQNAEAFAMFASGSFKEAAKVWNGVLRAVVPHVRDLTIFNDEEETSKITLLCVPVTPKVAPFDERIFPLFAQGILYTRPSPTPWSVAEYQRVAAVTCYNIGLCHHLQGLVERRCLQKAMRAYRHARDILDTCTMYINASTDDVKLIAMAITNNMGHVLEQSYETEQALRRLQELDSILSSTTYTDQLLDFHLTSSLYSRSQRCLHLHAPSA